MGKKAVGEAETDTVTQEPKPSASPVTDAPPVEEPPVIAPEELAKVRAEADGQRSALEAERAKRQTAEAELEQLRAAENAAAAETEVTGVLDGLETKSVEEQNAALLEMARDLAGRVEQLEGDGRVNIIREQYAGHTEAVKESGLEGYTDEQRNLDVAYLKEKGMPSLAEAFYSRNRDAIMAKAKAEGEKAGLAAHQLNKETGAEGVSGTAPPAEQMSPTQKEEHDAMVRRGKLQGNLPRDYGKT